MYINSIFLGTMKNRRTGESDEEVRGQKDQRFNGPDSRRNMKTKMRRNIQRLGGRGLSLEAFANVKSGRSSYNPSLIKKQREFYKNAKYVRKYKKSLKQGEQQQNPIPSARLLEQVDHYGTEGDDTQINQKRKKNKKKNAPSLKELYENKREEEEKARMEREASFKAKEEQRRRTEARRKALRAKMLKKTKSGQPVMKYRIEHMLETLQGSTS